MTKKPEPWAAGKTYIKGEQVIFGDVVYQVLWDHESSEFNVPGMCERYKPVRFIEGGADDERL